MDLEHLKKSRGARRPIIAKLLDELQVAILALNKTEVESLLDRITVKELKLLEVNELIEIASDPDDVAAEVTNNEAFNDLIVLAKIKANRFLKSTLAPVVSPAGSSIVAGGTVAAAPKSVRLPKLELPKFEGTVIDWPRFRDAFNSSIGNNANLSNVDKFSYLKSLLKENASLTVAGLALTDANFAIAYRLLEEKYGDQQMLVAEHTKLLWELKKVARSDQVVEIRKLIEDFEKHLRSLQNLGQDLTTMGAIICPLLLKCLPTKLVQDWHKENKGAPVYDVKVLIAFVKQEVKCAELACAVPLSRETSSVDSHASKRGTVGPSQQHSTRQNTSSTLLTTNENNFAARGRRLPGPFCVLCEERGSHDGRSCTKYTSLSERYQALRRNKRCTRCLRRSHVTKDCDQDTVCKICSKRGHFALLCRSRDSARSNRGLNADKTEVEKGTTPVKKSHTAVEDGPSSLLASTSVTGGSHNRRISILQTIRVWIKHASGTRMLTALIDNGSQRSFLAKNIVDELNLEASGEEDTVIRSFGGNRTRFRSKILPIVLVGANGVEIPLTVVEVPEICHGVRVWESSQIEKFLQGPRMQGWAHRMGTGTVSTVDVLIGADEYWKIMSGREKRLSSTLMATHSHFGWLLMGSAPLDGPLDATTTMCVSAERIATEELSNRVKQMWLMDASGTLAKENSSNQTLEELQVLKQFEDTTIQINGRYQVKIPWNERRPLLSDNFDTALERLRKLTWKLAKDEVLHKRYRAALFEYLANGHAEEVLDNKRPVGCYYMPHHAIIKDDRKTTKTRIVFDASSKPTGGTSLNEAQSAGANLNPLIFDLLTRFRWHKIAIVTDLSKAFLQVLLDPDDRDSTRFIWAEHPWKKGTVPVLKTMRMTRVLFGMKSSPFLLAATIRLHAKNYAQDDPELVEQLHVLTYVDDHGNGEETTQEAYLLSKKIYQLMAAGCMNFVKWATNSAELREAWVTNCFLPEPEEPIIEITKVLGLLWNPITDELQLKSSSLLTAVQSSGNSKRNVLEVLARVYDPLGLLSPVVVTLKKLLQDLWRIRLDWDEEMPMEFRTVWQSWKEDIHLIQELKIPRWLNVSSLEQYQLHTFCDASPRIFGAVCYLRYFDTSSAAFQTVFVAARSKLCPMQLLSVPRLELMACLVGSRLSNHITALFKKKPVSTTLWSDSKVALRWIEAVPSQWKLFVGRRVQEIQELTAESSKWRYCSSKRNIADFLTRGVKMEKLLEKQEWLTGPAWFKEQEEHWTQDIADCHTADLTEILAEQQVSSSLVHIAVQQQALLDYTLYSSWKKIIRITAWVFRFCTNAHRKTHFKKNWLVSDEINNAELFWIAYEQQQAFPQEFKALKNAQPIEKSSCIAQFAPFLENGKFLRLGGRLKHAAFTEEQKHPLLLKGGGIVNLFILDRHFKTLHGGVQATLGKIRDDVWLLRGRQVVRSALRECIRCRKWNAKPGDEVEAPLPAERINQAPAFHFTGLDYAGPLVIKTADGTTKAYICLFTCGITRAVHLELVTSLSTASFILALRRFFARRGSCKILFSDNAATYKRADKLIQDSQKLISDPLTQEAATQLGIEWRYIIPKASWWGGLYERLIGSTKHHLRRSLGNALLDADELYTLLTEIEAVLNNRPLTPLTEDSDDQPYLSPAHFLTGRKINCLAESVAPSGNLPSSPSLLRRWKYRSQLLNKFWQQWRKEYLLQLRTAHEVRQRRQNLPVVRLNDVVLKMQDKVPRGRWPLCRVVELTPGRDGKVRSVLLKTPEGSFLRRTVQQICPLEVGEETEVAHLALAREPKNQKGDVFPTNSAIIALLED